jgi:outer membrane protein assembly factor BamB
VTRSLRLATLLTVTALLSACGIFGGDDDDELKPKELVSIKSQIKVQRVWTAKVGGSSEFLRVALQPVGDGNRVYAASRDGNVVAFNPEDGKVIWRAKLDIELSAGPGVGEGRVVVVSSSGLVITLDASSGAEQWRADVDGESLARPLIRDEAVVVQTTDNRLQGLSLFDGRSRWSHVQSPPALTMRGSAHPVFVGGSVIAGFDNGRLVAVDLDTGDVVWEALLAPPSGRSDLDRLSDIDGMISVVGQDVYAAGYQGRVTAVAAESGQVLWGREVSSFEGVAADWNSLYTTRDNGEIVAFARLDGSEAWRNDSLLYREPTLPIPFGTAVAVGDFEGYLHFFSSIDGEAVARLKFGGDAISSDPVVIGNHLYVQSDSGSIAAYRVVNERPQRATSDDAGES